MKWKIKHARVHLLNQITASDLLLYKFQPMQNNYVILWCNFDFFFYVVNHIIITLYFFWLIVQSVSWVNGWVNDDRIVIFGWTIILITRFDELFPLLHLAYYIFPLNADWCACRASEGMRASVEEILPPSESQSPMRNDSWHACWDQRLEIYTHTAITGCMEHDLPDWCWK